MTLLIDEILDNGVHKWSGTMHEKPGLYIAEMQKNPYEIFLMKAFIVLSHRPLIIAYVTMVSKVKLDLKIR